MWCPGNRKDQSKNAMISGDSTITKLLLRYSSLIVLKDIISSSKVLIIFKLFWSQNISAFNGITIMEYYWTFLNLCPHWLLQGCRIFVSIKLSIKHSSLLVPLQSGQNLTLFHCTYLQSKSGGGMLRQGDEATFLLRNFCLKFKHHGQSANWAS